MYSDGGSIFKVWGGGGAKTNDQIFFTYNQGRQWRNEKFWKGRGIISSFYLAYVFRQN